MDGNEKFAAMVAGNIFAITALTAFMVNRGSKSDPSFSDDARRWFDSYLGSTRGNENVLSAEARIQARAMFNDIVGSSRSDISVRKLSLRRRFLNWLERG